MQDRPSLEYISDHPSVTLLGFYSVNSGSEVLHPFKRVKLGIDYCQAEFPFTNSKGCPMTSSSHLARFD